MSIVNFPPNDFVAEMPLPSSRSGTLADLPSAPDGSGPGTIVVGNVVALGHALAVSAPEAGQEVCHG